MNQYTRSLAFVLSLLSLSILLAACNSSNESGTNSGSASQSKTQSVSLSGDDTAALGNNAELSHYAYRSNSFGVTHSLTATNNGYAMNFARESLGEDIDNTFSYSAYADNEANGILFEITNIGISMRINKDGANYSYTLTCMSDCDGIEFNTGSRTLTLTNVVVSSSNGTSLTLNGTLVWGAADEDPNAPAIPDKDAPGTGNEDDTDNLPKEMTISISGDDVTSGLIDSTLTILSANLSATFSDEDPGDDPLTGFLYTDGDQIESGVSNYSYVSFSGSGHTDTAALNPEVRLRLDKAGSSYTYRCLTSDSLANSNLPDCSGITYDRDGDVITVIFNNTTLAPSTIFSQGTAPIVINGTLQRDTWFQ